MDTREYREQQFEHLAGEHTNCTTTLKLSTLYGSTSYLSITDTELKEIMKILTK